MKYWIIKRKDLDLENTVNIKQSLPSLYKREQVLQVGGSIWADSLRVFMVAEVVCSDQGRAFSWIVGGSEWLYGGVRRG